jgi:TRAP-type C4-dicarboxylate transport system substrate-binding protein
MKIRIQRSSIFKALVESLDASSSEIPWARLPTALRQKVVDDQENGLIAVLAAGPYQHRK